MAECDLNLASVSKTDAETLDRIDVVYEVTTTFVVTAGTHNGVVGKEQLAQIINSRGGLTSDDIDEAQIVEITVDDKTVARATSAE